MELCLNESAAPSVNEIAFRLLNLCGPIDHVNKIPSVPKSIKFNQARSESNFKHEYFV